MVRSQKVGCVILAGVLILEGFLGSACSRKEKTESTTSSTETIESESEDPSSLSSEETSSTVPQTPVDPVKEEALTLAAELGMKEEELRGKYDLFLKYADCVVNDPKTGVFRAYALHQFPIVADHLSPENEEYFLEKVRDLRFSSQALTDASGDFNAPGDIIRFSNDGINYDDDFTFTVLFHELTHFVDAFISGPDEADLFYTGKRFAYQDDFTQEEWNNISDGFYPCVASSFVTEGGAELYMAKYHAKVASTYLCEVHFLTGFEWIYGSDALDELFFSPQSSVKFVEILQDIGYTDEPIVQRLEIDDGKSRRIFTASRMSSSICMRRRRAPAGRTTRSSFISCRRSTIIMPASMNTVTTDLRRFLLRITSSSAGPTS